MSIMSSWPVSSPTFIIERARGGNTPAAARGPAMPLPSFAPFATLSSAEAMTWLLITSFEFSSAWRKDTPLLRSVPRVLQNLAVSSFLTTSPKSLSFRASHLSLPCADRMYDLTMPHATTIAITKAHQYVLRLWLTPRRTFVESGMEPPSSANMTENFGSTRVRRMMIEMPPVMLSIAGYIMADNMLSFSSFADSRNSFSLSRTISSTPPASPARIMFT